MEERDFKAFRDKGLLWAINRQVFHPRGRAMAVFYDTETGEVTGWDLIGNGIEPISYDPETDDEGFAKFNTFLKELDND